MLLRGMKQIQFGNHKSTLTNYMRKTTGVSFSTLSFLPSISEILATDTILPVFVQLFWYRILYNHGDEVILPQRGTEETLIDRCVTVHMKTS